jgi:hypothetical protein
MRKGLLMSHEWPVCIFLTARRSYNRFRVTKHILAQIVGGYYELDTKSAFQKSGFRRTSDG